MLSEMDETLPERRPCFALQSGSQYNPLRILVRWALLGLIEFRESMWVDGHLKLKLLKSGESVVIQSGLCGAPNTERKALRIRGGELYSA